MDGYVYAQNIFVYVVLLVLFGLQMHDISGINIYIVFVVSTR